MSENQPEISDSDLDQVAGGNSIVSQEQLNQQGELSKMSQDQLKLNSEVFKIHMATESADSLNKRLSEIKKSLEHDLKK